MFSMAITYGDKLAPSLLIGIDGWLAWNLFCYNVSRKRPVTVRFNDLVTEYPSY